MSGFGKAEVGDRVRLDNRYVSWRHNGHTGVVENIERRTQEEWRVGVGRVKRGVRVYVIACECGAMVRVGSQLITRV